MPYTLVTDDLLIDAIYNLDETVSSGDSIDWTLATFAYHVETATVGTRLVISVPSGYYLRTVENQGRRVNVYRYDSLAEILAEVDACDLRYAAWWDVQPFSPDIVPNCRQIG